MNYQLFNNLFRRYSKTYYYSSLWFPKGVKEDVFVLYSFVRLPDEYVDNPIENPAKQLKFYRQTFDKAWKGQQVNHPIISEFVVMAKRRQINKKWVDDFLNAMEMDLTISKYATFEDLKKYTYGSAEVIGLMMLKIMGVDDKYTDAARKLGMAMQLTNFVRDIKEDFGRGRIYMPLADLKKFNISPNKWGESVNPEDFCKLIKFEIDRIREIQSEAENGFKGIPAESRKAVVMASELYKWALERIYQDPMIVWCRPVKPSWWQIGGFASKSLFIW